MDKKIALAILLAIVAVAGFGVAYYFNLGGISARINYVTGTEYQHGEVGSVIIRVTDTWGNGIPTDWCKITVYYPDGSVWVDNADMIQRANPPSTFVYYFKTPFDVIGNYHSFVTCQARLPGNRPVTLYADKAFHVQQTLSTLNDTMSATIRILT